MLHPKTVLILDPLKSLSQMIFWGSCFPILGILMHLDFWNRASDKPNASCPLIEWVGDTCILITRSVVALSPLAESVNSEKEKSKKIREPSR